MLKRQVTIIIAILVLIGGYVASKKLGESKTPTKKVLPKDALKIGLVKTIQLDTIEAEIPFSGKLVANQKIDVFAEVQGVLRNNKNDFKVGNFFKQGEILLNIDNKDAQMSLAAQKSNFITLLTQIMPDIKTDFSESFTKWDNYLNAIDINDNLPPIPEIKSEKERYFITSKNVLNQYYNIKSAEVKLSKYLITAPFDGVITESIVTEGTIVRPGQKLGEFANMNEFELETSISIKDLDMISVNTIATLYSNDIEGIWNGKIKRISKKVDENTQSVKVFISVNGDEKLKEGLYLNGILKTKPLYNVVEIPSNLIIDRKIYTLNPDSTLSSTPVKILKNNKKTTIISGIENNITILYSNIPGIYEGMKISPISQ